MASATVSQEDFVSGLESMAALFGVECKPAMVAVYWKHLAAFDAQLFQEVVNHIIMEEDRFPTIAVLCAVAREEFRKEINGEYSTRHDTHVARRY